MNEDFFANVLGAEVPRWPVGIQPSDKVRVQVWTFLIPDVGLANKRLRDSGIPVVYDPVRITTAYLGDHKTMAIRAPDGTIVSIVDVATGVEAVAPGGRAALLQLHPDHPAHWDAWDVDRHYRASVADIVDVRSFELLTGMGTASAVIERAFREPAPGVDRAWRPTSKQECGSRGVCGCGRLRRWGGRRPGSGRRRPGRGRWRRCRAGAGRRGTSRCPGR